MKNTEKTIQTILGADNRRNEQNSMRFKRYLLEVLRTFLWEHLQFTTAEENGNATGFTPQNMLQNKALGIPWVDENQPSDM
jgi:hypothetical protein